MEHRPDDAREGVFTDHPVSPHPRKTRRVLVLVLAGTALVLTGWLAARPPVIRLPSRQDLTTGPARPRRRTRRSARPGATPPSHPARPPSGPDAGCCPSPCRRE